VHIVNTAAAEGGLDSIQLLPATGSGKRLIISNQDAANDCVATAAINGDDPDDKINGAATIAIAAYSSITLVDWAAGKWLVI
jgi:hypothetical protein